MSLFWKLFIAAALLGFYVMLYALCVVASKEDR